MHDPPRICCGGGRIADGQPGKNPPPGGPRWEPSADSCWAAASASAPRHVGVIRARKRGLDPGGPLAISPRTTGDTLSVAGWSAVSAGLSELEWSCEIASRGQRWR